MASSAYFTHIYQEVMGVILGKSEGGGHHDERTVVLRVFLCETFEKLTSECYFQIANEIILLPIQMWNKFVADIFVNIEI